MKKQLYQVNVIDHIYKGNKLIKVIEQSHETRAKNDLEAIDNIRYTIDGYELEAGEHVHSEYEAFEI